jgi:NADPH:quinone reductase-like Zn-dependent oxidoreductase
VKAIVQDRYGSPDVLELRDVDVPVPRDNQVLVRVHAAGVDPGVWHLMTGLPYALRLGAGLRAPRTRVRGMDFAGQVTAVGAKVTGFQPGDEVFGTGSGSFAEYVAVRAGACARKPARLTFEQAAAVPSSGCTALKGLRDAGQVRPGQHVLVIGAAGGVGTFAVQLAKAFAAHVTGVCSTSKVDLVRSIGADDVVDYTREDFVDGARRYDLILDTAGNRPLSHLRRALTPRGTLAIIGGEGGGRWLGGTDRGLRALALSPLLKQNLRMPISLTRTRDLQVLGELIDTGKVTPVIDRTYPLHEAPDAMRYLQDTHARGKVVITVGR